MNRLYRQANSQEVSEFQKINKTPNIMTPHIIGMYASPRGNTIVEFSQGKGIFGGTLYGVTVVCQQPNGEFIDAKQYNDCFESHTDAEAHMISIFSGDK